VLRRDEEGVLLAPEQAITAEEALYAYTMAGALASGDENEKGDLRPGKWADMAVLRANPIEVNPEEILSARVDMTFLGGELVFER
jgi:predicted amidohydrolase YtcJ